MEVFLPLLLLLPTCTLVTTLSPSKLKNPLVSFLRLMSARGEGREERKELRVCVISHVGWV